MAGGLEPVIFNYFNENGALLMVWELDALDTGLCFHLLDQFSELKEVCS